jgi:glycerol-3-phosphate dehydrogenase
MAVDRAEQLNRLDGQAFDLLVVGGGIVGSRVAYDAARSGMRTALVDRGDFACATSSSSSKLIHGGLRYLSTGNVRLVRRLQAERNALMTAVAPHLVRELPMLVVVDKEHRSRAAKLAAGLGIYTMVAASQRPWPRLVRHPELPSLVPELDPSSVAAAGLLREGQTHDARLVLATVTGAATEGALTVNYVELCAIESARRSGTRAVLRDRTSDRELVVHAKAIVNATGPWIDHVRLLEDPHARPLARLSKGVHAVLPLEEPWAAGLALFDESSSTFAVPWQGMLLVGATDTEYDEPPERLRVGRDDLARALEPLSRLMTSAALDPRRVVSSFAGLRVLPRGIGPSSRASRDHLIDVGRTGMVSVAGGKLTTHRAIARDALACLPAERRPRRLGGDTTPLPGARIDGRAGRLRRHVDASVAGHLLGLYGADAIDLLSYEHDSLDAFDRIHPGGPDIWAQVYRARDAEWAVTVDDVVARRTTLAVRGLADGAIRERIAAALNPTVATVGDRRVSSG